ncbi:MAG: hypothetical protein OXU73_02900 [Candidatus Campbellbacteria bacterium]|nr:hypothetical protein [Candidatus Campbellbacteria bacterium]
MGKNRKAKKFEGGGGNRGNNGSEQNNNKKKGGGQAKKVNIRNTTGVMQIGERILTADEYERLISETNTTSVTSGVDKEARRLQIEERKKKARAEQIQNLLKKNREKRRKLEKLERTMWLLSDRRLPVRWDRRNEQDRKHLRFTEDSGSHFQEARNVLKNKILEDLSKNPASHSKLRKVVIEYPQHFDEELVAKFTIYENELKEKLAKAGKGVVRAPTPKVNQTLGDSGASEALQKMKAILGGTTVEKLPPKPKPQQKPVSTPNRVAVTPKKKVVKNNIEPQPQVVEKDGNRLEENRNNLEKKIMPEIEDMRGSLTREATTIYKFALAEVREKIEENFNHAGERRRIVQAYRVAENINTIRKKSGREFEKRLKDFCIKVLKWNPSDVLLEETRLKSISKLESEEKRMKDLMPYIRAISNPATITGVINEMKYQEKEMAKIKGSPGLLLELNAMKKVMLSNPLYVPSDKEDAEEFMEQYELKMGSINSLAIKSIEDKLDDKDRKEIDNLGNEKRLYEHFIGAHKIYLERQKDIQSNNK